MGHGTSLRYARRSDQRARDGHSTDGCPAAVIGAARLNRQPYLHRRTTINSVEVTTPSIHVGTASNATSARRSQTAVSVASASPDQVAPVPRPAMPPTATPPTATTGAIGDEHAPAADTGRRARGGGPSALTIQHTPGRGASPLPAALTALALSWKHGIIVVGDPDTAEAVQAALNAGAGGYLFEHPPPPPPPRTPPGRHATHRSDTTLTTDEPGSPDHADQPAPGPPTVTVLDTKGQPCTLSRREIEVLQHVADGETNIRIGRSLGVSPDTVKGHLRRTGRRLTTNDRTQMMFLAMRAGAIE